MGGHYLHVEWHTAECAKHPGAPCGDVTDCRRGLDGAMFACVDGIGSGMRARIAAQMCAARLIELLRLDFSLRRAAATVAADMQKLRDPQKPFAAFSVGRIRPDGMATVLAYEAPPPLYVGRREASVLPGRPIESPGALVNEYLVQLDAGDGLMLLSDGITQAGIGGAWPDGWQAERAAQFLTHCLNQNIPPRQLPETLLRQARQFNDRGGDDCTAALAYCRRGVILNLLTGPPADRARDAAVVRRWLDAPGLKVVCGGTTAEIVARQLGLPLSIEPHPSSLIAPPRYELPEIDLVTEGAVTLNQAYNLIDEDPAELREDSGVSELVSLLNAADRINIFFGQAENAAARDISFRQQGILTRRRLIPLLAERLRAAGKMVVVENV